DFQPFHSTSTARSICMKAKSGKKSSRQSNVKQPPAHAKGSVALRAAAHVVQARHLDAPPKVTKPKSIHPRRLLPFVAPGQERPFHSLNTRAIIHGALDATQDIQIAVNTPIPEPGQKRTASNVGEPSVSVNSDVVFYTGNWYAALSVDGGKTFSFIDPNSF